MVAKILAKEFPTLQSMKVALRNPKTIIGKSGGREFELPGKLSVKLKNLITHVEILGKAEYKKAAEGDAKKEVSRTLKSLTNEISELDIYADAVLSTKTTWQKIMTAIRRFFGNLFCTSHTKRLATLYKKAMAGDPNVNLKQSPLSKEAKAIYAHFVKAVKDKRYQEVLKTFLNHIKTAKDMKEEPKFKNEEDAQALHAIIQEMNFLPKYEKMQLTEHTRRTLPDLSTTFLKSGIPEPILMQNSMLRSLRVRVEAQELKNTLVAK